MSFPPNRVQWLTVAAVWMAALAGGLAAPGDADPAFNSGAQLHSVVRPVARLDDGRFIVIGDFSGYGGALRQKIARVMPNGTVDPTFDPGNGPDTKAVSAAALLPDGKLLVGGDFANFGGVARRFL